MPSMQRFILRTYMPRRACISWGLLFLLALALPVQACRERFNGDIFLGCELASTDRMLNTHWVSIAEGTYGSTVTQGVSFFDVDSSGRYMGHSYYRDVTESCLRVSDAWYGQLYKMAAGVYAVWNDGATDGFYFLAVDRQYMNAHSVLLGASAGERDDLVRVSANASKQVTRVIGGMLCHD